MFDEKDPALLSRAEAPVSDLEIARTHLDGIERIAKWVIEDGHEGDALNGMVDVLTGARTALAALAKVHS